MGYSGARGTLIYEKNLKSKISYQTPFKEGLDQGHLHPKLEVPKTDISGPGIEPGPPQWESSTPEKSHSNSLLIAIRNIYILARNMAPLSACVTWTQEHTWTALWCRPNSTCKAYGLLLRRGLASPHVSNLVRVATMESMTKVISILN